MANEEQLAILKRGVGEWNAWTAEHPDERADFSEAKLRGVDLGSANLRRANLRGVYLSGADLCAADLSFADLGRAQLFAAHLPAADLSRAYLHEANLSWADLTGANLTDASLIGTVFGDANLSAVTGLDTCRHQGPSILDHHTITKSWPLTLSFLRGCGLPERLIEY